MEGQQPPAPEEKKVWIACRATPGCAGNQAVVVFNRTTVPTGPGGTFSPEGAGRVIRYRCCTCGGAFHIRN